MTSWTILRLYSTFLFLSSSHEATHSTSLAPIFSTSLPKSSITCYDCTESTNEPCSSTMSQCPMCMISRSDHDPSKSILHDSILCRIINIIWCLEKFDRKCCWWGCGSSGQVSQFNGRPTYFCDTDRCNGPGREELLIGTTTAIMTTSTTKSPSFRCYSCSGTDCGREDSPLSSECPSCMVYRNYSRISTDKRLSLITKHVYRYDWTTLLLVGLWTIEYSD